MLTISVGIMFLYKRSVLCIILLWVIYSKMDHCEERR